MAAGNVLELIVRLKNETAKGVKAVEGGLKQVQSAAGKVGDAVFNMQTMLAGLGIGAVFANLADDASQAAGTIKATSEAAGAELEALGNVAREVWENAYGDNMTDAAAVVVAAHKKMRTGSEAELQSMTEKALALQDAFGDGYQEQLNTAETIVKNFGLSWDEAFDFITSGYQKGLNASGDFLDSINEYSTQFSNGGASAEQFFSLMETGLQNGMLGTDKAADAFKEFRVRIQDGSATTSQALQMIGLDADAMGQQMASGSMSAAQAFQIVIERLQQTRDTSTQMQAGVGLLGTQFEDLGNSAVMALDLSKTRMEDLSGAAARLEAQYQTVATAAKGLWREILGGFVDQAQGATRYFVNEIESIREAIQELKKTGRLKEWADQIAAAVIETYQHLKEMARVVFAAADAMSPLLQMAIRIGPELIAFAAASAAASKAIGVLLGVINAGQAAMAMPQIAAATTTIKGMVISIQAASTQVGILQASTVSLGAALTTAAGAAAAFFGGWQIGKLISSSNLFGQLPLQIGEYVQIAFGQIDRLATQLKIKLLELRKAWNEVTGDKAEAGQIQKAIDAEKMHLEAIRLTIQGIREKGTAGEQAAGAHAESIRKATEVEAQAQAARIAATQTAEQQVQAFMRQTAENYVALLEEETAAAKAAYDARIAEIDRQEARGVLNHNQALQARLDADVQYHSAAVAKARAGFDQVAAVYGQDTAQYKAALEAKKAALDGYLAKEQQIAQQIRAINDQVAQSRQTAEEKIRELKRQTMGEYEAYQDKVSEIEEKIAQASSMAASDTEQSIALYKEAMNAATSVSGAVQEGERTVVSQNQAVQTAIQLVEKAQAGIEAAAKSRTDALTSAQEQMRGHADEARSQIEELNQLLSEFAVEPIVLEANADQAVNEITRVRGEIDQIAQNHINLGLDTSDALQQISAIDAKLDALQSKFSRMTSTIEFKGKASPERPLMETIQTVEQAIDKMKEKTTFEQEALFNFKGNTGAGETGATQAIEDLQNDVTETQEQIREPLSMRIDISPAKAALQELAQEAYRTSVASHKLAMQLRSSMRTATGDLKRLIRQNMKDVQRQADRAQAEWKRFEDMSMNVNITGTGSTKKPITEKLREVTGQIKSFAKSIPDTAINTDFRGMVGGMKKAVEGAFSGVVMPDLRAVGLGGGGGGTIGGVGKVKDMGKMDLLAGGKSFPVMGQPDVLEQLKTTLRRERRITGL